MKLKKKIISFMMVIAMVFTLVTPVQAASIKISKKSVTIYVGSSTTLKITGTKKKVTWSSDKKKVATVNSKGKVTAKLPGTATIKAKVSGKTYSCKVTVRKVGLSKNNISLAVGNSAKIMLNGGKIKSVKSSNNTVATITKSGKITAKKVGKAVLTITSINNKKYTCKVTVTKKLPKGQLSKTSATLAEGDSITLSLKGAKIKSCKSNNTSVATVDNSGKITALSSGDAKITVTDTNNYSYICSITVKKAYRVYFESNGGSSVTS